MKTCSSLLHRLQSPHLWHCWQRLTAAFISSRAFSLCSSDSAPGILLCSSPRLQRIWNNSTFSHVELRFTRHPTHVLPSKHQVGCCTQGTQTQLLEHTWSYHWLSDVSCPGNRFGAFLEAGYLIDKQQMRPVIRQLRDNSSIKYYAPVA